MGVRGQLTKLERLDHGLDYMMELPGPPHNEITGMKNKLQKWRKVLRRKVAGEREARIERDVEAAYTFDSLHNCLHSKDLWHLAKDTCKKAIEGTQTNKESDDLATFLFAQVMNK